MVKRTLPGPKFTQNVRKKLKMIESQVLNPLLFIFRAG